MPFTPMNTSKRRRNKLRRYISTSAATADEENCTPSPSPSLVSSPPGSSPSSNELPNSTSIEERDLICRANLKSFLTMLDSIGFVDYFTSDAGGRVSMTSVKLYVSRLQHFMEFCRRINSTNSTARQFEVTDVTSFLDLWDMILRRLAIWLPSYTKELTNREELAPDTVRNIINQFKAIIKWYLLFASELREDRLDIHTTNMLYTQSCALCQQLTRQFNKAVKKRRMASGKDLLEFKVTIALLRNDIH